MESDLPVWKCLFSAPSQNIPGIRESYSKSLATSFREIWHRSDLSPEPSITAWVVNPGQRFVVDTKILESFFPNLRVLVTPSTGTNHVDKAACDDLGVAFYGLLDDRTGLESISASAEFTFLLLLNSLRRLDIGFEEVKAARWRQNEDRLRGRELSGKRVGIVGLGRIGIKMARYCAAFQAHVAYHDPHVSMTSYPARSLREIFTESDIVCVCCVLTPDTAGMITGDLVGLLPAHAILVNTSRGEVLDEYAIAHVLRKRPDVHVAVDVIAGEVTGEQFRSPFMELQREGRIMVTPHIAGATVESQQKAAAIALCLLKQHILAAGAGADNAKPNFVTQ